MTRVHLCLLMVGDLQVIGALARQCSPDWWVETGPKGECTVIRGREKKDKVLYAYRKF